MFRNKRKIKKDIFEKQISAINIWTTIMGLTFLLIFGGIGYLQFKSAVELSDTLKEMKTDMKDYAESYKQELSQNLDRIDNIEYKVQYQVDREIKEMRDKINESIGNVPEPPKLELTIDGLKATSKIFEVSTTIAPNNNVRLSTPLISISNVGGKSTNELIIYMYSIHFNNQMDTYSDHYPWGNWRIASYGNDNNPEYKWVFQPAETHSRFINAGESWTLNLPEAHVSKETKTVELRIAIYYGSKDYVDDRIQFKVKN